MSDVAVDGRSSDESLLVERIASKTAYLLIGVMSGILVGLPAGMNHPVVTKAVVSEYPVSPYLTAFGLVCVVLLYVLLREGRSYQDVADTVEDHVVRDVDEIESKIDELNQALTDPSNEIELLSNRSALDALVWVRGVDEDVVVDLDVYERRGEQ